MTSIASFWQLYLEFNMTVCQDCPQSGVMCCRCSIPCCQGFNLTTECFLLDLSFIVTHIQTLYSVRSNAQNCLSAYTHIQARARSLLSKQPLDPIPAFDVVGKTQPSTFAILCTALLNGTPHCRVWGSARARFGIH